METFGTMLKLKTFLSIFEFRVQLVVEQIILKYTKLIISRWKKNIFLLNTNTNFNFSKNSNFLKAIYYYIDEYILSKFQEFELV